MNLPGFEGKDNADDGYEKEWGSELNPLSIQCVFAGKGWADKCNELK
ncbi:MAG: hypothetical protein WBB45_14830 [Cyclobacteriaceae bacterium]